MVSPAPTSLSSMLAALKQRTTKEALAATAPAASGGGGSSPAPRAAPSKPTHVERFKYSESDPRSRYMFDGNAARMDKIRKSRMPRAALNKEEASRPDMHATVCKHIMDILLSRFTAEDVEAIYCQHAGIDNLNAHLSRIHSRDPNWHPAKWDSNPLRPFILVAQAIYDDTSVMSFPKKLSTLSLANLAVDTIAIIAFVDGLFPPSLASVVPTAEASSEEPTIPEDCFPEQVSTFPLCISCNLFIHPYYGCSKPCNDQRMCGAMNLALTDSNYAQACDMAMAMFLNALSHAAPNPFSPGQQ